MNLATQSVQSQKKSENRRNSPKNFRVRMQLPLWKTDNGIGMKGGNTESVMERIGGMNSKKRYWKKNIESFVSSFLSQNNRSVA